MVSERAEIERRWRMGEERLYPIVTVRPDLYEAVIGLVRALADHLGSVPDLDALVTTYRNVEPDAELAQASISRADLNPEIDFGLVRDAAYQVRARELAQREAAEHTRVAIQRARAAGQATAIIWQSGQNELWPPYRRVEMSVASGNAIAVSTELDAETMTPLYTLEGLALDPDTGEPSGEGPLAPRREFADPETWRAAAAELRQSLLIP